MRIIQIVCSIFFISIPILTFSKDYVEVYFSSSQVKKSLELVVNFEPKVVFSKFFVSISDYGEFKNFVLYETFYSEESSVRVYELQTYGEIGVYLFDNFRFFFTPRLEVLDFYNRVVNFYYGGGVGLSVGKFYVEGKVKDLNLLIGTFNIETTIIITNINDILENLCFSFSKDNVAYPCISVYSDVKLLEFDILRLYFGAGVSVNFQYSLLPYRVKLKVCLLNYELFSSLRFSQYLVEGGLGISYSF